ncbi:hypothetical protein KKH27_09890 [bacterium]|nr:hypothetical protein [bacterium]MBU1984479.1 hypothetical protein [bacterium]
MGEPSLAVLCTTAFVAVFILLAVLAGLMYLIMLVFPVTRKTLEPVHVAAITSAVQALAPGARVTRIEELR